MPALPVYQVRATNTAPDSENKIHDDRVAAQYGFRGGLVPGVTVYGYMAVPVVRFTPEWLERGSMKVRFIEPFYDGDQVLVRCTANDDGTIDITAEREDGRICSTGTATMNRGERPDLLAEYPLPVHRPIPSIENVLPGSPLGTIVDKLDDNPQPQQLLQFANNILISNFELGPWIHTASELTNWSAPQAGEEVSARGRIVDRFDRKGHELVTFDVMLVGSAQRLLETIRHTAIYRLRQK